MFIIFELLNRWINNGNKENEEKKKRHFQLLNLPQLAWIEIIKMMSYTEQVNLYLAAKKMKDYVKMARVKANICTLIAAGPKTKITLDGIDAWENFPENRYLMNIRDLIPYTNRRDIVEDACFEFETLRNIINCKSFGIELCLDDLRNDDFGKIRKTLDFLNFEHITLRGGTIQSKDLDLIMETAVCKWKRIDRSIKIIGTQLPLDYYHENVFKFFNIHYDDACWIRPEHLYSLRNRNEVILGKNTFTSDDFHAFVMYWINCDHDMFRVLTVNLSGVTIFVQNLFSSTVFIKTFRSGQIFYLISSHGNNLVRKLRLLVVRFEPGKVIFTACNEQESISISVDGQQKSVSFEYEFWTIQRLKRRNQRKYKLNEVEMMLKRVTSDEAIRILETRKTELEKEIETINEELERDELYYTGNNIPTMDEYILP